jgi:hypothetical protein
MLISIEKGEYEMKLKSLVAVTLVLSSLSLISCTASGTVNVTGSPSPTPNASASPTAVATASASPAPSASPSSTTGTTMTYKGTFTGSAEIPPVITGATGTVELKVNTTTKIGTLTLNFVALSSNQAGAHIHGPAASSESAPVLIPLPDGQLLNQPVTFTDEQFGYLNAGKLYVNIHSTQYPNGEIRAQLIPQ